MMKTIKKELKNHWQLYLLIVFPILNVLFHQYGPMYGVQIAFRDYRPRNGIWGSEWVGLKWFQDFLSDPKFLEIFSNTVILAAYNVLVTFPLPIIFAILVNCINSKKYQGVVQNVTYMPHFISTTVLIGILQLVLSPVSGLYGAFFRLFGGQGYPVDFRAAASSFRHLYVWSGVWQNLGWESILYTSALSSVSMELHEAARIDGASRFKRVLHIDLPAIMPTIAIMFIMRASSLVGSDMEKAYLLQSNLNLTVSEVLSTHVFKKGLSSIASYSYGAAVGMFNNVLGIILMVISNQVCKKLTDGEVSYF